ncbi:MAG: hypothetical protein II140_06600, partial [Paludibacteraceae bacterium]|nr:hypothetical protein [Paludibacteraceae bacterium]
MKKRFLPFLFLLIACACPLALYATGEVYDRWDGTTDPVAAGTTYYVSTARQLAWIAEQDNDFAGKTI